MTNSPLIPENATVIVAHPDDEVLWFNSVLTKGATTIVAFQDFAERPGLGTRRAAAMAALPYPTTCLGLPEAGTFRAVDWAAPQLTQDGLRADAPDTPPQIQAAYSRNYHSLLTALDTHLTPASVVFTHNPWGEYGHPDHVQLYRALELLHARIGFSMWVSAYVAARTKRLARRYAMRRDAKVLHGQPDPDLGKAAMQVFKDHDCWTWRDDWNWAKTECFLPAPLTLDDDQGARALPDTGCLQTVPAPL